MSKAPDVTRRDWLLSAAGCGLGVWLAGCAARILPLSGSVEAALMTLRSKVLPILQWRLKGPNPGSLLRKKARPARGLSAAKRQKLDQLMRATLKQAGGVGLAAPQVGVSRRMVLVQLQDGHKPILTCVDPQILRASAEQVAGLEGCLSVKGVGAQVLRSRWVELRYRDLKGQTHRRRCEGWEARIFQHELDHLDGVLYVDKLAGELLPMDEVRRRRKLEKKKRRPKAPASRTPAVGLPTVAAVDPPASPLWL